MRKIRELLRLKFDLGLSIHKIAASLSIARSTVTECLRRAATAEICWPLPHDLHDDALEALLYPKKPMVTDVPLPDFNYLQRELSRPGVTRLLLWHCEAVRTDETASPSTCSCFQLIWDIANRG